MKSIEPKAIGECIGGVSGDAASEIRVDPLSVRGAKFEECALESTGEAHLER
jgi:hypothetical protein